MKQGKTNSVLPREHTGHSKHPLPTTHEKTLHTDITRWSVLKSYWLYLCSQRWRSSVQSAKTRPGADCGLDHELFIAIFRLKLKKVEKTTRQFRHDTSLDEVYLPCSDSRAILSTPSKLERRLDFPGPTREAPWVPHCNSRIPPQLQKNQEVPPSSRDEALSRCSVSREIPRSLLKFEMVLDTFDGTQNVRWHTCLTREEHWVSQHNLIWPPSPLLVSTWG